MSRSKIILDLDRVFSKYIRNKYADHSGQVECFTCGTYGFINAMDNGHYRSRKNLSVRWDERNCRAQCKECNNSHSTFINDVFRERLILDIGLEEVEKLEQDSRAVKKYTAGEIKELIKKYK